MKQTCFALHRTGATLNPGLDRSADLFENDSQSQNKLKAKF